MHKLLVSFLLILLASTSFAEPVWIDVRSAEEHAANHISGDIRISHNNIVPQVENLYPDKNTQIHVYCKSGGRAAMAASSLKEAGYGNVVNAGGIDDAREARGLGGD